MKLIALIAILITVAAVATLIVVALYLHKKASTGHIKLIGEFGQVDTDLDPEGTVIVCGELWRARPNDGVHILKRARIRVVDFQEHLALVERCD